MRRLFILLPLLLTLVSCGKVKKLKRSIVDNQVSAATRIHTTTDPAFFDLIEEFEEQGRERYQDEDFQVGDIPINFGDTGEYAGLCITYASGAKEILINADRWKNMALAEVIFYHELGHCRLNREHNEETSMQGSLTIKTSVMNSVLLSPVLFSAFKDEYLHELFTGDLGPLMEALKDL